MRSARTLVHLDPVPAWKAAVRKAIPLFIVSRVRGVPSCEAFDARAVALQRRAIALSARPAKLAALWRIETLAASLARCLLRQPTARPGPFRAALAPIAHMGFAVAAVEACGFDAAIVRRTLEEICEPAWIGFAYESVGAMLALYERDVFHTALRTLSRIGAVPLVPLDEPNVEQFVASLEPETVRLISHGYGRLTYFKSSNALAAIRAARRRPFLDGSAWTQGVALAHAYVNSCDLSRILSDKPQDDDELANACWRGQVYALALAEWSTPGFLDAPSLACRGAATATAAARHEISVSRAQGFLKPFAIHCTTAAGAMA